MESLLCNALKHGRRGIGSTAAIGIMVLALPPIGHAAVDRADGTTADSVSIRIDEIQQMLRRNPADASGHLELAELLRARGNLTSARAEAETVLRLAAGTEDSVRSELLLADIAVRQDRPNEALRRLKSLALKRHAPPNALAKLAQLLWADRFTEEALMAGMEAIRSDPGDPEKRRWVANRWKEVGHLDQALVLFRGLCDDGLGTVDDEFQTGFLAQRLRDGQGALDAYMSVLRRAPEHAEAHYNLSLLLLSMGDSLSAASHLESAIGSSPRLERAYFDLAILYMRLRRADDARRILVRYRADANPDSISDAEAERLLDDLSDGR